MAELSFEVLGWLAGGDGDAAAQATLASLSIVAGEPSVIVTEVEDRIARTVRPHINVPASLVAEWLLMNWWRLRWEGLHAHAPSAEWRRVHWLSGIGGDHAWPALELSSDGEFINLHMEAEAAPDVAAVRYLRSVDAAVPASDFEAAVDRFVGLVEPRVHEVAPGHRMLAELRAELADERSRSTLGRECRWQALAGINPGDADEGWLRTVASMGDDFGAGACAEILSTLPDLDGGLPSALAIVDALKASATTVDLSGVRRASPAPHGELPWQKGARLAAELRSREKLGSGPLSDANLGALVSSQLPLQGEVRKRAAFSGGFRNGVAGGRTRIALTSHHLTSQRFYLARLIGAAHVLDASEHVVPVTNEGTALQKLERSFAQELLCPWAALDAFTDESGTDDEGVAEAAEHFEVSEWLIQSTLVNRGKISRYRLPAAPRR
ncbi:MAG: hypothetical protein HY908_00430 [Myxococcales bacterium]|nr:hypothetical protein [Myxococcales bacterium]